MNKIESFKIGLKGLQSNKLRAALTMLGIVFGVAAVIAMMSIGEGARQETLAQIELMGTNNIIITSSPVEPSAPGNKESKASFSPGLSLKDAKAIKELNPLVQHISPQRELAITAAYKSNLFEAHLVGTTIDYPETFNSRISSGTFFNEFHMNNYSNVCVIGAGIKEKYFKFENPIRKRIKLGELWFEIIGVAARKNASGSTGFGLRDFNEDIYVPITTMMYKMEKGAQSSFIMIRNGVRIRGSNDDIAIVDKSSVDQLTVKVKDSDQLKEA